MAPANFHLSCVHPITISELFIYLKHRWSVSYGEFKVEQCHTDVQ